MDKVFEGWVSIKRKAFWTDRYANIKDGTTYNQIEKKNFFNIFYFYILLNFKNIKKDYFYYYEE